MNSSFLARVCSDFLHAWFNVTPVSRFMHHVFDPTSYEEVSPRGRPESRFPWKQRTPPPFFDSLYDRFLFCGVPERIYEGQVYENIAKRMKLRSTLQAEKLTTQSCGQRMMPHVCGLRASWGWRSAWIHHDDETGLVYTKHIRLRKRFSPRMN
jgi:hypothetical protein